MGSYDLLRYDGAWSISALYVNRRILNSVLNFTETGDTRKTHDNTGEQTPEKCDPFF